jgi:glycosyltransferase involved in cell wall biosynthesis
VIITGTDAGRDEVKGFYQIPDNRIRTLPQPTPRFSIEVAPDADTATLAKYGIPEGYLFYPSQFWAHKNHANLLLAVRELRDEHGLIFPVVLVGSDKGNMDYVKRLVRELGLETQVHFLGFVPEADLITFYRKAFALTYMTFFGPDNLPPLEAFSLECPVVASNVDGAGEQLGEAALLVDPKNPHQIAQAVKSLRDEPGLRQALIERGLKRASVGTGRDFINGLFSILDEFEAVRRCWGK